VGFSGGFFFLVVGFFVCVVCVSLGFCVFLVFGACLLVFVFVFSLVARVLLPRLACLGSCCWLAVSWVLLLVCLAGFPAVVVWLGSLLCLSRVFACLVFYIS